MNLYTPVPASVSIFRKAELGADLATQLLLFDLRQSRAAVADLYTPVPNSVRRIYRRADREAAKEKAKARRELNEGCEAILRDPNSSEEDRLLARIELVSVLVTDDDEDDEDENEDGDAE